MADEVQEFSCVVSADIFRRVYVGVSTDDFRASIRGVQITPSAAGGAILCGTDGRILIAIRDPQAIVKGSEAISLTPAMLKAMPTGRGQLLDERLLYVCAK